jgi:hypothetical protein
MRASFGHKTVNRCKVLLAEGKGRGTLPKDFRDGKSTFSISKWLAIACLGIHVVEI